MPGVLAFSIELGLGLLLLALFLRARGRGLDLIGAPDIRRVFGAKAGRVHTVAMGFIIFQLLDLGTTLYCDGGGDESNPVMRTLFAAHGAVPTMLATKIGCILVFFPVLAILKKEWMRLLAVRLYFLPVCLTILGNFIDIWSRIWPYTDRAYAITLVVTVVAAAIGAIVWAAWFRRVARRQAVLAPIGME